MKSSYWISLAAISSCALALAMPAAANDGCGRYDRYDDGDAAGGAITGAVVGGAVAGPPGAVVGAVIGGAAGDDDDCGYRHDGYSYNDGYSGGYSNDRYDGDDDNSGYRQGYSEGYEAGQMRQLNGMDRGYRAEGYYARRDDYRDATYDEERTRYRHRGYYRHYRASSCWDPCRSY